MPKAMPDEGGEMDSLYSEDSPSKGSKTPKTVDQEEAEQNADSDVIKTSVLQSGEGDKVEVGDERVVKVLEVYGDTCKVMYAPKEEKETPEEEMSPNEEIDQMSSEHDAAGGAKY